jgi:hypothetical protein
VTASLNRLILGATATKTSLNLAGNQIGAQPKLAGSQFGFAWSGVALAACRTTYPGRLFWAIRILRRNPNISLCEEWQINREAAYTFMLAAK